MAPVFTNDGAAPLIYGTQYIPVFFNGALIGRVYRDDATTFCNQLRMWKLENGPIPACTEIVFIHPEEQTGGPSPAVYLSTDALASPARGASPRNGQDGADRSNGAGVLGDCVRGGGYSQGRNDTHRVLACQHAVADCLAHALFRLQPVAT